MAAKNVIGPVTAVIFSRPQPESRAGAAGTRAGLGVMEAEQPRGGRGGGSRVPVVVHEHRAVPVGGAGCGGAGPGVGEGGERGRRGARKRRWGSFLHFGNLAEGQDALGSSPSTVYVIPCGPSPRRAASPNATAGVSTLPLRTGPEPLSDASRTPASPKSWRARVPRVAALIWRSPPPFPSSPSAASPRTPRLNHSAGRPRAWAATPHPRPRSASAAPRTAASTSAAVAAELIHPVGVPSSNAASLPS